jgi:moderate conductance mechanosensitive channel
LTRAAAGPLNGPVNALAAQGNDSILTREWVAVHGVRILIVLAIAIVFTLVARYLCRRLERRLEGTPNVTGEILLRRTATVTNAIVNVAYVVIWTITILTVLDQLGVNLAPFIAGASIAGVALGFGAQSIVKDWLSGLFIVLERQFDVGDTIDAHTVAGLIPGKVEGLTLRATSLRDFDGTLHVIPNGNMQAISNKTRGWARAIVDVRIAYEEDVDKVRGFLEELFGELRQKGKLGPELMSGPEILGVDQLSDYAVVVRVYAETQAGRRYNVERRLREAVMTRLSERGVRVPLPPTTPASPSAASGGAPGVAPPR